MDELQRIISEWAEKTFKHTDRTIALHLLKEAVELCMSIPSVTKGEIRQAVEGELAHVENSNKNLREEAADVAILAFTLAGYDNFSLKIEVERKMGHNRLRQWGDPDTLGIREHVAQAQAVGGGKGKKGEGE